MFDVHAADSSEFWTRRSLADSIDRLSTAFTQSATSALIAIPQSRQNIATVVEGNLPTGYYNPDLAA
jgi:hypothetical protein